MDALDAKIKLTPFLQEKSTNEFVIEVLKSSIFSSLVNIVEVIAPKCKMCVMSLGRCLLNSVKPTCWGESVFSAELKDRRPSVVSTQYLMSIKPLAMRDRPIKPSEPVKSTLFKSLILLYLYRRLSK